MRFGIYPRTVTQKALVLLLIAIRPVTPPLVSSPSRNSVVENMNIMTAHNRNAQAKFLYNDFNVLERTPSREPDVTSFGRLKAQDSFKKTVEGVTLGRRSICGGSSRRSEPGDTTQASSAPHQYTLGHGAGCRSRRSAHWIKRTLMKGTVFCLVTLLGSLLEGRVEAESVSVNVPGSADPWLAGMPDGATASGGDVSPVQSPVEVLGLPILPGTSLRFLATGLTAHGPTQPLTGPDGNGFSAHIDGAENGISDTISRTDSLLGVFLGTLQPDLTPAPAALDFTDSGNVPGGVNYTSLSPLLKQVFFIGDGITDGGQIQQVVVPAGGTRLYLGTKDGFDWSNNIGSLDVQVTLIPEPSTLTFTALSLLSLVHHRHRRRIA